MTTPFMPVASAEAGEAAPASPGSAAPLDSFVPVEGGRDTVSAELLLVLAYAIMWTVLFGFLLVAWRRQKGLDARLDELEAAVTSAESRVDEAPPP